ncbi:MAG: hypothetical protein RLZZ324_534 [Candidatus Parcubacteria bacterium]
MEGAAHVSIDDARLVAFADKLALDPVPTWDRGPYLPDAGAKGVLYALLLNAIDFCYWPGQFETEHRGMRYGAGEGDMAIVAALARAFESGSPLADPAVLSGLDAEALDAMLGCEGEVPLMEERAANARNLGATLLSRYGGDPLKLVEECGRDAERLADLLAANFTCFEDRREWRQVFFAPMRRAQRCAVDIAEAASMRVGAAWTGLERLTCLADDSLPQLFHEERVFRYAPALEAKIMARAELSQWSEEEAEIRAATIVATERVRERLADAGRPLAACSVDRMLRAERTMPGRACMPCHRVRTVAY